MFDYEDDREDHKLDYEVECCDNPKKKKFKCFTTKGIIGKGAYGDVWHAIYKHSGKEYALK